MICPHCNKIALIRIRPGVWRCPLCEEEVAVDENKLQSGSG